jgi:rhamnogalacturonan endolyase
VFGIHERPVHPHGANLRDAATGRVLWGKSARDVGRGVAFDIDPRHRGAELWAAGFNELWNVRGEVIGRAKPRSCNLGIWWDADPQRELLDGVTITKWDYLAGVERPLFSGADFDVAANNGSKANPCLCADLFGDWREELVCRTRDNRELRIFTTPIPASRRRPTLMHDPVYRLGIAGQNVAYNQPAHPGFFLDDAAAGPTGR